MRNLMLEVEPSYDTDVAHSLILVIFGRDVAEGVCYRMVICCPTSLTNVSALPGETRTPEIVFSVTVANWVFAETTNVVGSK